MNYNRVILAGTLTRDPEIKFTPKGSAVAKIGIAINRHWATESGEKKEEVVFIDCESWGKQAETLGQYFRKGSRIHIEGRLKLDQWEDKQTHQKQSKLKVVVDSFQFVDRKADGAPRTESPRASAAPAAKAAPVGEDDQVPF